jgi:UDP-glucose 4-epimerase
VILLKRVLITGANSYVGTNVEKWLMREPDKYYVETLDMKDPNWKNFDFSKFDVVFHVAGIAHLKEKKKNRDLYYKINRDLAIDTAINAKESGIKHFIFMSTMSVYGISEGVITRQTNPTPNTHYGKSKLDAEQQIELLSSLDFCVSVLRPPMIYGYMCTGNYAKLSTLAKKSPIFPQVNNKRSAIFILNFSELVKIIINKKIPGLFYPQNNDFLCSSEYVKLIANFYRKKIILSPLLGNFLKLLKFKIVLKVFGSLVYDKVISEHYLAYCIYDTDKSIVLSEGGIYE